MTEIVIAKRKLHFLTILIAGCSATYWAVAARSYALPLIWLLFFSLWIVFSNPQEFRMFIKRISKIGGVLVVVSLFQIIFRRYGEVIFAVKGFPLIYAEGLREAVLLWIRYMIIFMLAYLFSRISMFEFLLFLNKIKISTQFSLLLLTTLRFIPFLFDEAKKGLWSVRFRGFDIGDLTIKQKYLALRKILMPLLFRGIHYASFSSLALELRGYGTSSRMNIPLPYPMRFVDYLVLLMVMIINLWGIRNFLN